MKSPRPEERRLLASIIVEALCLADQLDLDMVGISLNGALERLTGLGIAVEPAGASVH